MDFEKLLELVAGLVPTAKAIIDTLHGAVNSTESGVIDLIAALTPIAAQLIASIQGIRDQTQAQHPEVWAAVSADWQATAKKWAEIQAAAQV